MNFTQPVPREDLSFTTSALLFMGEAHYCIICKIAAFLNGNVLWHQDYIHVILIDICVAKKPDAGVLISIILGSYFFVSLDIKELWHAQITITYTY